MNFSLFSQTFVALICVHLRLQMSTGLFIAILSILTSDHKVVSYPLVLNLYAIMQDQATKSKFIS